MLHIGAVGLDVLTQFFGNFAVAGEEIFTCHTFLTRGTARRNDVLRIFECLGHIGSSGDVGIVEATLTHLLGHAFGREHVEKTDVGGETHHKGTLHHVRADHTGCTYDNEFFVS